MDNNKTELKCFFCRKPIVGTQHGVWPFVDDPSDPNNRCCDECNKKEVVPAIKSMARLYKNY